ncbi:hypothetical protein BDA99DRAFT_588458 [Phascolomyces articulosus]|uniref:Transmembrane protein n=1 Tax=Phascolomyces articulosus TaxID=60185 RepID=A0AAD5PKF1_9FUNG|nr:hypothetical protein BDA99DRAFT_588458 [Phascolomyces articulosus]
MTFKAKHDAIAHITLLVLVQWISIAVIVLNAIALNVSSNSNLGLITSDAGPQDHMLLVIGAISLLGSSLLLCLHLHVFLQLMDNRPFAPSKTILALEMTTGVVLIGLWASATSIIMTNYNVSSPCRTDNSEFVQVYGQACSLLSNSIILAFAATGGWLLIILATLITLTRSSLYASATVFTVESPTRTKRSSSAFALVAGSKSPSMQSISSYQQKQPTYPSTAVVQQKSMVRDSMDCGGSTRYSYQQNGRRYPQTSIDGKRSFREHTASWCSEYSTATTAAGQDDTFGKSSMDPISLGDLPRIQEGMSNMDLSFLAQSYNEQQQRKSKHSLSFSNPFTTHKS